ncbi:serine/arginine repetitive matrix protein 2 [Streptomyces sp. NPDC053253]|uniref:serine/arginine repetitive matrix protein 2 n=1 Tax=Streptomyces sp. NPDC053253 TaxID=3365699 RepID=UPI0037CF61CF
MSARWNDETQSWETAGGTRAPGPSPIPAPAPGPVAAPGAGPVVPPPPPPPSYAPEAPPSYTPAPSHAPAYVPETGEWQYPTAPAPAAGGRARTRGAVAAGAAVAVLAAGSVGAWLVWGKDDGGKAGAGGGPAVSVSAPVETPSDYPTDSPTEDPTDSPTVDPTDTASPSGSASSTQPADGVPPPAYSVQKDLKGFTIAVPDGWDRTESDQGIFYNAPDGKSLLQVFVITEPDLTPYEALRGASDDGKANKPGYVEIGLDRVTGEPGAPADSAELVYAYDREGGRRKVVDRAFTAADGNHYAILSAGPETDWPKQREVLRVALEFFRPGAH